MTAVLLFLPAASSLLGGTRKALTVQTTEARFDGKTAAEIPAGTEVEVLGEKAESGEVLIRFRPEKEREVLGLVPSSSIVEISTAPAAKPATTPPPPSRPDFGQTVTAEELAAFMKNQRDEADDMVGTRLTVTGVVEELRVTGSTGAGLIAEITLRTAPGLPKVRAHVHASEFLKDVDRRDQELRVQNGKILEGRSRSNKHDYRYYSYWYGVYRPVNKGKSSWLPIVSIDHPVEVSGIFRKYHINIDLDGAALSKG
ncbi:MAG: hypothetical protein WEC73_06350 [Chthoniobacterales bacterium]